MVAYQFRLPQGIVGNVSRNAPNATIEPKFLDPANKPLYGAPVKLASGLARSLAAADAATVIYGWLVRPYPTSSGATGGTDTFGATTAPNLPAGILKRGYLTVLNRAGTPAPGGIVYVRVNAATGSQPLGGVEAAADSTNTVIVPNTYFNGAADADGTVEIAYNL